jgi:hypothetical protein
MTKQKNHVTVAGKTYISLSYLDNLSTLSSQLKKNVPPSDFLLVPFILTCAAALEAMLNDEIISWAQETFASESYKRIADAHLSMSLRGKLEYIVPLMTHNSYILRTNSVEHKTLSSLITRRNELMHGKAFFQFNQVDVDGDAEDLQFNPLNLETLEKLPTSPSDPFDEVTVAECLSCYEALEAFETKFLYHLDDDSVTENDMIMRNPRT